METDTIMVRAIPPRLKGKIARRVERDGSNMNDVLVGILADEYGVPFTPSGVRRSKVGTSERVLLEMPAELKRQIAVDAAARGAAISDTAKEIISKAFGVKFQATARHAT